MDQHQRPQLLNERRYHYRITVFGEPRSEWRGSVDHAMDDAILLGLASYDESQRQHYLAVPVEMQRRAIAARS